MNSTFNLLYKLFVLHGQQKNWDVWTNRTQGKMHHLLLVISMSPEKIEGYRLFQIQ